MLGIFLLLDVQVPCLPAGRDSCSGHKKPSTNVGDS